MFFSSFFCFSFHRELFWKPCAYQIYAKRSSNCELMLRHEKKNPASSIIVSTPLLQERGETLFLPRYLLTRISFVHRCSSAFSLSVFYFTFHFLLSCLTLYTFMHLNCSEFTRRVPLQCENAAIQCNLPQSMKIRAKFTCQGAKLSWPTLPRFFMLV